MAPKKLDAKLLASALPPASKPSAKPAQPEAAPAPSPSLGQDVAAFGQKAKKADKAQEAAQAQENVEIPPSVVKTLAVIKDLSDYSVPADGNMWLAAAESDARLKEIQDLVWPLEKGPVRPLALEIYSIVSRHSSGPLARPETKVGKNLSALHAIQSLVVNSGY